MSIFSFSISLWAYLSVIFVLVCPMRRDTLKADWQKNVWQHHTFSHQPASQFSFLLSSILCLACFMSSDPLTRKQKQRHSVNQIIYAKTPAALLERAELVLPHELKRNRFIPNIGVKPRRGERPLHVLQNCYANRIRASRTTSNQNLVFSANICDCGQDLFGARSVEDETNGWRDSDWSQPVHEATKRKERRYKSN